MKRAVFLDRDGVLNRSVVRGGRPYAPISLQEFELLPGVREAVTELRNAGFILVVVTNQAGVARGLFPAAAVDSVHAHLLGLLDRALRVRHLRAGERPVAGASGDRQRCERETDNTTAKELSRLVVHADLLHSRGSIDHDASAMRVCPAHAAGISLVA